MMSFRRRSEIAGPGCVSSSVSDQAAGDSKPNLSESGRTLFGMGSVHPLLGTNGPALLTDRRFDLRDRPVELCH